MDSVCEWALINVSGELLLELRKRVWNGDCVVKEE